MRKVFIFCLLFFLFSCEEQIITVQDEKSDVKIDSSAKCGCPADYGKLQDW